MKRLFHPLLALALLSLAAFAAVQPASGSVTAATYYVSSSDGDDDNTGLSTEAPFETVAKVNSLDLQPGDRVLFKCGDTWRAEMLRVTRSGSAGSPITYSSYPSSDCANKPVLSGAQPITGWSIYSGSIYVADLTAGDNAGRFPIDSTNGINQLFRNGDRLGIGRWPNIDAPDGGYSTIDGQPGGSQITDNELPAGDWNGATMHIKGMRWYILNRTVTSDSGNTLTLNTGLGCWGSNCTGWGFWLDSHLGTLDREGEWYYDTGSRRVYLYSASDPNGATIEGSVVLQGESEFLGGIILGVQLWEHITDVVIENFEISKWFDNGITTPLNLEADENANITIRNNLIQDVDGTGINLMTWVWNAAAHGNGYNGWRGGKNIQITGNTIERANRWGINTYARSSLIQDNVIRDIGRTENLGKDGLGCTTDEWEGDCTEDGDGIRLKVDSDGAYSSNYVTVQYNRLERVGYSGIQVYGFHNTLDRNVIVQACITKGDCGGISSYGGDDMGSTPTHDLTVTNNIIIDTIGNTDGAKEYYDPLFGFGLYFGHNTLNVTSVGNTVINSTVTGILYMETTGVIQNNTLFNNSSGTMEAEQIAVTSSGSQVWSLTGNIMLAKLDKARTLAVDEPYKLSGSDYNAYYHPTRAAHISIGGDKSLAQWQSASGQDIHSVEQINSVLADAVIFYNDTKADETTILDRPYNDLSGNPVGTTLTLQPFTSKILVPSGDPWPILAISKTAPSAVHAGDQVTYTLTVANSGTAEATGLLISDQLPADTIYLGGGTLVNDTVQWTLADLPAGESIVVTFSVSVTAGTSHIVNETYGVTAEGGFQAQGTPVHTLIDPKLTFLPVINR